MFDRGLGVWFHKKGLFIGGLDDFWWVVEIGLIVKALKGLNTP